MYEHAYVLNVQWYEILTWGKKNKRDGSSLRERWAIFALIIFSSKKGINPNV